MLGSRRPLRGRSRVPLQGRSGRRPPPHDATRRTATQRSTAGTVFAFFARHVVGGRDDLSNELAPVRNPHSPLATSADALGERRSVSGSVARSPRRPRRLMIGDSALELAEWSLLSKKCQMIRPYLRRTGLAIGRARGCCVAPGSVPAKSPGISVCSPDPRKRADRDRRGQPQVVL